MQGARVLSGMRPTGALHLGHYHGALENWLALQATHECFFFVADWHALTTHYDDPSQIAEHVRDMVIDWLAVGLSPERATIFLQSRVPQHAELTLLLSMFTPLSWLERVPTYKDQIEKLKAHDLSTYGFLGYPLMQAADILIYRASEVPVGEDQVPHIELTREVARRFNHLFGRAADIEQRLAQAGEALGIEAWQRYENLRRQITQEGSADAKTQALAWLDAEPKLTSIDRQWLRGGLEGNVREILLEPRARLTPVSRLPGLDGQKMSKSYHNTIALREPPESVTTKIRQMPTDPARVRRTDPGDPEKCPVWRFHQIYSDAATQDWVQAGCRSAGIGCIECKRPVADAVNAQLAPIRERAEQWVQRPAEVRDVLEQGSARARRDAEQTLSEVRAAMGLG